MINKKDYTINIEFIVLSEMTEISTTDKEEMYE